MNIIGISCRGYRYHWEIEEYHRDVKTQFHIEGMQLRKFESTQTLYSLVMMNYAEIGKLHYQLLLSISIKTIEKYQSYKDSKQNLSKFTFAKAASN